MTAVALFAAAAFFFAYCVTVRAKEAQARQHARERGLLIDQILHLSGRTWTPPPADEWQPPADEEPLVREWTATPEQQPYR